MPIPRLTPAGCVLLVIDLQDAFHDHIDDFERVVVNASILCQAARTLAIPVIATEQNPQGLGRTVAAVRDSLPPGTPIFEKSKFSAFVPEVSQALHRLGRPQVVLCGIEAHVCVLQSGLDLLAAGIQCFHATDAIGAGQPMQIAPAFRRLERAGSIPTGTLSCLYELVADARHPSFRECLALAKRIRAERCDEKAGLRPPAAPISPSRAP
ncbi:MAG: isochorismatase family protein [Phycisphaerae bacterium]|nr:isochorismatase family protein [Phycisphaerae bacterium]